MISLLYEMSCYSYRKPNPMKKQRLWSLLTVLASVALTSYLYLTLGGHGAAQPLRTTMTPLFAQSILQLTSPHSLLLSSERSPES